MEHSICVLTPPPPSHASLKMSILFIYLIYFYGVITRIRIMASLIFVFVIDNSNEEYLD